MLSRSFIVVVQQDIDQWHTDGVAAASSDGGPTGVRGPPAVLEFFVINFSVCLVLLSNCYIIIDFFMVLSSTVSVW